MDDEKKKREQKSRSGAVRLMSGAWAHREGTLVVAVDIQLLIVDVLLPNADILSRPFTEQRVCTMIARKQWQS